MYEKSESIQIHYFLYTHPTADSKNNSKKDGSLIRYYHTCMIFKKKMNLKILFCVLGAK